MGSWLGGSLLNRDTILLGEMCGLGLEELGAKVANFVISISTLSGLSGELLAWLCDMPSPVYHLYVPNFQMGMCGKKSLVVGRASEGLFSLCL